jgi:hypothetical protein
MYYASCAKTVPSRGVGAMSTVRDCRQCAKRLDFYLGFLGSVPLLAIFHPWAPFAAAAKATCLTRFCRQLVGGEP